MTREEAIIEMQRMKKAYCNTHTDAQLKKDSKIIDALDMSIKALEQQPCEDAISRAEVLDLIDSKDPNYEVRHFKEDVECLPPVSTEKTGYWIDDEFGSKCSCCGIHTHLDKFDRPMKFKYCPNCGAKMVVDEPVDKTNESVDELKND